MKANWNYPTIIWSGKNRIKDLNKACSELNIKNPLFVTDKDLINLNMVKDVINELKNNFKDFKIFSDFSGNPIGENVDDGVKIFNEFKCDGVIAFKGVDLMLAKPLLLCQDNQDQFGILKI